MTRQWIFTAVGIAAFGLGLFLLYRVFRRYDFGEIISILGTASAANIGLALLFTIGSYACVVALEVLAVIYTGQKVNGPRVAMAGVAAVSIGRSIGFAALSSGAVRYRMYERVGLRLLTVGTIVVFSGVSVALGLAAVGGGLLLWRDDLLAPSLGLSSAAIRSLSVGLLVGLSFYVLLCATRRRPMRVGRRYLRVPPLSLTIGQVALSSANLLCIGGVLFILLRGFTDVEYPLAAMLYLGSDLAAVIGHVPGGWGVLEYVVTGVLTGSKVVSGIILFRAIYYLVPLGVGLSIFLIDEWHFRRMVQPALERRAIAVADRPNAERS